MTQYMVQNALMAITEVSRFLQLVTRFAHISGGILVHSSLQIFSKSLSLGNSKFQLHPQIFYGIKVWRLAGLLLEPLLWCLGGMFWVIVMLEDPRHIFSVLTEGRRFLSNILRYMAPSIGPSMWWSRPVPLAEKQPQSMMFPPRCLTVGMVFLRW